MALLVGRLGKKIYWHNPIYCALFKLSIRENLCIQIPGKFVTHLMCTDNNILHTFFFFIPPQHLSTHQSSGVMPMESMAVMMKEGNYPIRAWSELAS